MEKTKIMPGELFIVEYENGGFKNEWAFNASKEYIEIEPGRTAASGMIDVLVKLEGKEIIENRFHITKNAEAVKFVKDAAIDEQRFAEIPLKVLKVQKETEIYSRTGSLLGTIPAGSLVGTEHGDAGNSMRYLMIANAYNDGSGWKFVNQQTYSYGFINVEKGHATEMFDPEVNLVTAETQTPAQIDWEIVENVINTVEPEMKLRGDLSAQTKEEVVETVNDHFASVDLKTVDLMDPIEFFGNVKNRLFVEKELAKVNPVLADDYFAVAQEFSTK